MLGLDVLALRLGLCILSYQGIIEGQRMNVTFCLLPRVDHSKYLKGFQSTSFAFLRLFLKNKDIKICPRLSRGIIRLSKIGPARKNKFALL